MDGGGQQGNDSWLHGTSCTEVFIFVHMCYKCTTFWRLKNMANPATGVRLRNENKKRLEILGREQDRSTSYLVNKAVEQFLDREEALRAEKQLVVARWKKFELTGETLSHNDVENWAAGLAGSTRQTPE